MTLVLLGFILGFLVAIPLVSAFWGFAFSLTVSMGKEFTLVDGKPKWKERKA